MRSINPIGTYVQSLRMHGSMGSMLSLAWLTRWARPTAEIRRGWVQMIL